MNDETLIQYNRSAKLTKKKQKEADICWPKQEAEREPIKAVWKMDPFGRRRCSKHKNGEVEQTRNERTRDTGYNRRLDVAEEHQSRAAFAAIKCSHEQCHRRGEVHQATVLGSQRIVLSRIEDKSVLDQSGVSRAPIGLSTENFV
jgi:hypothetical protein